MPEPIGWVIEREAAPGFIAGLGSGFVELALDPVRIALIAAPEPDRPGNRMNDAKADSAGRIWAGTMPFEGDRPTGALYRLGTDRTVVRMDDGYRIANGPAIPPDGSALYHGDSGLGRIYRFPLSPEGSLGARETFVAFEPGWGAPDGMTFDRDGGLWVACWGASALIRFAPDGRLDQRIELPASQITSCAFAGEGLDRLFVTSASEGVHEAVGGALFEVESGRRGFLPHRYGG
jgi:sugar lactone lactonase YvrE